MNCRHLSAVAFFLVSISSQAAVLLDSVNVTFTEKNAFLSLTSNPPTVWGISQFSVYDEVYVNRKFQIVDGYRLSDLQFVIQQTDVSIGAEEGGWGAAGSVISASVNDPSYGAQSGNFTWVGPGPTLGELDYPGGNTPSSSLKVATSQSGFSLAYALSGLIDATANPLSPFSSVTTTLSHQFDFTSAKTITSASFTYRIDLYDQSVSEVPLPMSAWLFGPVIAIVAGCRKVGTLNSKLNK